MYSLERNSLASRQMFRMNRTKQTVFPGSQRKRKCSQELATDHTQHTNDNFKNENGWFTQTSSQLMFKGYNLNPHHSHKI